MRDRDGLTSGRRDAVQLLVLEPGEVDGIGAEQVGPAAVLVDPTAGVERRGVHVRGPVRGAVPDHDVPPLLPGAGLHPVRLVPAQLQLAEADGLPGNEGGRYRRSPRTEAEQPGGSHGRPVGLWEESSGCRPAATPIAGESRGRCLMVKCIALPAGGQCGESGGDRPVPTASAKPSRLSPQSTSGSEDQVFKQAVHGAVATPGAIVGRRHHRVYNPPLSSSG